MYKLKCSDCNNEFEKLFLKFSDFKIKEKFVEGVVCPNCKSSNITKNSVSNIGISFKGNGYYIKDSKK